MQIMKRSEEPVRLRDAGKELWRWRYVASWLVVVWALIKVAEFLLVVRSVPTFTKDDHDGQVEDQPAQDTAAE